MAVKYDSLEEKRIAEDGWIVHSCGNAIAPDTFICPRCKDINHASTNTECPVCGADIDSINQIAALKAEIVALKAA